MSGMTVELRGRPDPGLPDDAWQKGFRRCRLKAKGVDGFAHASRICLKYIGWWSLKEANWSGGRVLREGTPVARVLYDGAVVDMAGEEIFKK